MGISNYYLVFSLLVTKSYSFEFTCYDVYDTLFKLQISVPATQYACLYVDDTGGSHDIDPDWNTIFVEPVASKTSIADLVNITCIEIAGEGPWRIEADDELYNGTIYPYSTCAKSFELIFTSSPADAHVAHYDSSTEELAVFDVGGSEQVFVDMVAVMLRKRECTGAGNVTIYTRAGVSEEEALFIMKSWRCADFPDAIISFNQVITVKTDEGIHLTLRYEHFEYMDVHNFNYEDQKIVIMARNDIYNFPMGVLAELFFGETDEPRTMFVVATCAPCSFDPRRNGYLSLQTYDPNIYVTIRNESTSSYFFREEIDVFYETGGVPYTPYLDNFVLELSFTAASDETTIAQTTPEAGLSSTSNPSSESGDYCGCALDSKFGLPEGWDPNQIWIDVVIILDTSEAMGEIALVDASNLIESFIGTDDFDVLITDNAAKFYTRIGLIAMSNEAEVIYNLNMTKADKVLDKVQIKTGVTQINVVDAFDAALAMFNDGLKSAPDRANTRQVIYYMTDSDPTTDLTPMNQFKTDYGIIIVNNFIDNGAAPSPGLKNLASDGYFRSDIQYNYMDTIQLFCKANCYCQPDSNKSPYAGQNEDPAVKAAGGCFYAAPIGVPFSKARSNCDSLGGGKIASIHDQNKAEFVQKLMAKAAPKSDYSWIGYSKSESDGQWRWEDESSDSFTNWDVNEPSTAAVAKCAYVDSTSPGLNWGAGNCAVGFPSVCEFAPCAVGNRNC